MTFFKQTRGDNKQPAEYLKHNPLCEPCRIENGIQESAIEVHHITPAKAKMKIEHILNYLSVCRVCHFRFHSMRPVSAMIHRGMEIKYKLLQNAN